MTSSAPDRAELEHIEQARRRRAAELIGDLLPTTTTDESDEGWSEARGSSRDEEYLRDVPPHHG